MALKKPHVPSPKRAFQEAYPHIHIDPRLFKFVGIDPPLSLEKEKATIGEAMRGRLAAK